METGRYVVAAVITAAGFWLTVFALVLFGVSLIKEWLPGQISMFVCSMFGATFFGIGLYQMLLQINS